MSTKPTGPAFEYFPESRIELGRELHKHPKLMQQIMDADIGDDYAQLVGIVAAHFNILMDGMYTPADIDKLAEKLVFKLRSQRVGIITPPIGTDKI